MRTVIVLLLLAFCCVARGQTVTAVSPNQAYQGQSLSTSISSSGLFMVGSSPQGNIMDIILKNSNDSVFAVSDSINVVDANTATTFWNIPGTIATGLYTLVVRVYDVLFSGSTSDYTLSNAFTISPPQSTVSGTVYDDLNHNGLKDAGEPGLAGYTVRLSPLGNIGISDAAGHYTISSIPGTDTLDIQVPADDLYITSGAAQHILTIPAGATTGLDFGLYRERYLISMNPDSASTGTNTPTSILSSKVFKNGAITSIVLRNSITGALLHASASSRVDSNRATATFGIGSTVQTGYYDLVVVVRSTVTNTPRTFTLDSAFKIYGPVGVISGYAFTDANQNGTLDGGETPLIGRVVTIRNASGSFTTSRATDSSGFYQFYTLPDGTYTVTFYNPGSYYSYCGNAPLMTTPGSYVVTIARDTITGRDFGLSGNVAPQSDLFIHPGWSAANPGFLRHYWIYYGVNNSAPATNVVITMQYDSTLIFDHSAVPPTSHDLATHTLTWNVGTVSSYWQGGWSGMDMYFQVPVTAVSGQLLHDVFTINSTGTVDCNTGNNILDDYSMVTSSMDPNEKHSVPYNGLVTGKDSVIDYTINFQNTGTASTHFVIVKDTLDPNLEFRSVIVTGTSGEYKFDNNNGVLTFTMDPLVLTDSATDEPHSHGFVSFKVKVKAGTPIGTVIRNTANIYFDYNEAVNTNTAINTVYDPLSVGNIKDAMKVSVYPNPFAESTRVAFSNPSHDKYSLKVYDIDGNLVRTLTGSGSEFVIEREAMALGVYMYKLTNQTTKQSASGKITLL